ncbi:16528_t:CDS:10 [Funneliformis mosseae]|uniref:16528_t:CDS:1 n=1 Tax=Funneliformis mosseae TaxID=27381 RepID=A0A9N9H6D4_FUNMO|nr:16528_t:CDS:10 [Funneliformis mosseae]
MSKLTTSTEATLAETNETTEKTDKYFTLKNEWSLPEYLLYRQKCTDFQPDKHKEHSLYTRSLSTIMNMEQASEATIKKAGNALVTFQWMGLRDNSSLDGVRPAFNHPHFLTKIGILFLFFFWILLIPHHSIDEKKSQLVKEFWKSIDSSQKRKFTAVAERTALTEEHITDVVFSTFEQERTIRDEITQQGLIVRSKFARCLEDTDLEDCSSKRQCLQVDDEPPHTPEHQMHHPSILSSSEKTTKPPKKKSARKRGDTLPGGAKIEMTTLLNLLPWDNDDSTEEYNDDNDDEEGVPSPEGTLDFILNNQRSWILPSNLNVGDIVAKKISENAKEMKKKKKLSAIKKAVLRYGLSQIIDLSAHMKQWFSLEDRRFMMKDYMSLLQVPGLKDEETSFVTTIEKIVLEKRINEAYEFCTRKFTSSEANSYMRKISKVYLDFIYRSEDGDMLDSAHTEIDIILKACSYIVEGLRKSLVVKQRWGESFCPLSRSTDYKNGRKCDAIGDRCRSARINQSILNGLLNRNLTNEQVKKINVPFLQIAGTNGQMLIEDLIEGFYVVFPGPKFELPTKLQHIEKLKSSVNIIKFVMDMYEKISEIVETKESTNNAFDDIFDSDELDTSRPTHYKSEYIREPWWTPKSNKAKVTDNK